MKQRRDLIKQGHRLSLREQCKLLCIHRSGLYYQPAPESQENLDIMRQMDEYYLNHPTYGVLQMEDYLRSSGYKANHKRVRRLLRKMGLMAIYPKKNLSKPGHAQYVHPYLLKHLEIKHPNQVWAIDITYLPMAKGFLYLIAIIDVYSRFVVGWDIYNSLDAENCLPVLDAYSCENGHQS